MKSIYNPNPFTKNAFTNQNYDVMKFSAQKRLLSSQQMPPFMNQQQKPGEALAQYSTDLVSLLIVIWWKDDWQVMAAIALHMKY